MRISIEFYWYIKWPNLLDATFSWTFRLINNIVVNAMKNYGSYEEMEALKSMSPTTRKVVKYMSLERNVNVDWLNSQVIRLALLKMA